MQSIWSKKNCVSNFTMEGAYELKKGDRLVQRFRILVHEGLIEDLDVGVYHREFCRAPG